MHSVVEDTVCFLLLYLADSYDNAELQNVFICFAILSVWGEATEQYMLKLLKKECASEQTQWKKKSHKYKAF